MKEVLVSLVLVVILVGSVNAATYYVDATGGLDSNDGLSEGSAWQTISKVNSESFLPGDFILFKRGEIWREQVQSWRSGSGNSTDQITYSAYGSGEKPVFSGASLVQSWSLYNGDIYRASLNQESFMVLKNNFRLLHNDGNYNSLAYDEWDWDSNFLYINISQDPNSEVIESAKRESAFYLRLADYITIENLHITKAGGSGITQYAGTSIGIKILNNTIDYNYGNGILLGDDNGGDYWIIKDNIISNNGRSDQEHGIYFDHGTNAVIENNLIKSNSGNGIQLQDASSFNTVRYNKITGSLSKGVTLYDNGAGACENNLVYYNLLINNRDGLGASESVNGNIFYNNVIYNSTRYGIYLSVSPSFPNIQNNIILNSGSRALYYIDSNVITSDYNIIGPETSGFITYDNNNYDTLSAYQASENKDLNSIVQDPLFISPTTGDFHLQAGSPAIDAGTDVGLLTDFDGNPIVGNAPDIGAFEFQGLISNCGGADTSGNSIVEIGELLNYISDWKAGSVVIGDLLTAIGEWKNGC